MSQGKVLVKVLIIDKNPLILKFCHMVLAKAGFHPISAQTPLAGLQALESNPGISAILVDNHLQSPKTEDLLQSLEMGPTTCNIPIFVFRHPGDCVDHLQRFPALWQTIEKPFSPATLLQSIQKATQEHTRINIPMRREMMQRQRVSQSAGLTAAAFRPQAMPLAKPALQGQLEFLPIGEILQLLHYQNQTGVLHVQNDKKEIFIYFDKGLIQFSNSRNLLGEFRLGRILIQKKYLHPEQFEQFIQENSSSQTPLGSFLIQQKHIDHAHLITALRHQTSSIVYELLRWPKGIFTFATLEHLPVLARQASLNLKSEELLLEGFRLVDEWNLLLQSVGTSDTIFERTPQSTIVLDQLSPEEKNILRLADGTSTLEEISERSLLPQMEVYRICQRLSARKIVQRQGTHPMNA